MSLRILKLRNGRKIEINCGEDACGKCEHLYKRRDFFGERCRVFRDNCHKRQFRDSNTPTYTQRCDRCRDRELFDDRIHEAKPCPFCKHKVIELWKEFDWNDDWFYAICLKCYARTKSYKRTKNAIKAWNRRAGRRE